jgi:hypothetical protein
MGGWGFYLPMATAIPVRPLADEFTVYDIRVCNELGAFHPLGNAKADRVGTATASTAMRSTVPWRVNWSSETRTDTCGAARLRASSSKTSPMGSRRRNQPRRPNDRRTNRGVMGHPTPRLVRAGPRAPAEFHTWRNSRPFWFGCRPALPPDRKLKG